MKITKIYIKNLFSYDEFKISFDNNFNTIVGPNNAGKTNLFRVIQLLMDIIDNKLKAKDVLEYLHDPTNEQAEIKIWVEFDEGEKKIIRDFFECYFDDVISKVERGISTGNFVIIDKNNLIRDSIETLTFDENTINELRKISPELAEEMPERPDNPEKLINEKIQRLNQLFIKTTNGLIDFLSRQFLTKCVFIWKYSGEYDNVPSIHLIIGNDNILLNLDDALVSWINKEDLNSPSLDVFSKLYITIVRDEDNMISSRTLPKNVYTIDALDKLLIEIFERNLLNFLTVNTLSEALNLLTNKVIKLIQTQVLIKIPELSKTNLQESKKALANRLFSLAGLEFSPGYVLSVYKLILRLFYNSMLQFAEVRGYPHSNSRELLDNYNGDGYHLANYLFNLKNSPSLKARDKYQTIKKEFERVFNHKLSFDVVLFDDTFKIVITESKTEHQYDIQRVASGVFEILNILTVVYGNNEKVILLDEPALHLHPIYQKQLAKQFYGISTENQVIVITHSPYLVDSKNLDQVYRFYKANDSTHVVYIRDHLSKLDEELKFIQNDQLIRSLFSSGVLLVEGLSEYVSLPLLMTKLGYPLEDYNLEIVNVGGKGGFTNYINLFKKLQIPYAVVCDGETAFNVYSWNTTRKKFIKQNSFPVLFNALKENDVLGEEDNKQLQGLFGKLPLEINARDKKDVLSILATCVQPLYGILGRNLISNYNVFACPYWDWTDYLSELFSTRVSGGKAERAWKIVKTISPEEAQEKLTDLREFIKMFINSL